MPELLPAVHNVRGDGRAVHGVPEVKEDNEHVEIFYVVGYKSGGTFHVFPPVEGNLQ